MSRLGAGMKEGTWLRHLVPLEPRPTLKLLVGAGRKCCGFVGPELVTRTPQIVCQLPVRGPCCRGRSQQNLAKEDQELGWRPCGWVEGEKAGTRLQD